MNALKLKWIPNVMLGLLLVISSCSKDEELDTQLSSSNESELNRSCDNCSSSQYPGATFGVLTSFDLEYEPNGGNDFPDITNPHQSSACDEDYFTMCGSWMVLINDDDLNDRVELKTPSSLNFNFNSNRTLDFVAVLENIPTNGGNEGSDGVTIAQIHNRGNASRPLARVSVSNQSGSKGVYIILANSTTGSSSRTEFIHDFTDGDRLRVLLQARPGGNGAGQVRIYVYNYRTKNSKQRYLWIDEDWGDSDVEDDFYFKTGLYNQARGKAPRMSYQANSLKLSL